MLKLVLVIAVICNLGKCDLVVVPNLGKLEGTIGTTISGKLIYTFEGVPYAEPPIGDLRFKEPQPVKPWTGTWKATNLQKCIQYNQYTTPGDDFVIGDEDCLYLNIFSPNLTQEANLAVIVYIHGGSFMFNHGGLYRPDYLLEKDVILVTLNYRLGPLGFLSTEDDVVPGNNGLKDQILGLQFIKNYIRNFGGNPNSVTLVGNSAGGVSVHAHYLSDRSRGLFSRGISMSGTTFVPWGFMEKALAKTRKLAVSLGCLDNDNTKMINCLRSRPARQFVSTVKEFIPWLYIPFSPFGLVVDSWSQNPIFPDQPYNLLKTKQVYDVPWIASYTNSEGLYPAEEFYERNLEEIETKWNELIPLILDYNLTVSVKTKNEISQKIHQYFLQNEKLTKTTFRKFLSVLSQRLFVNGIQDAIKLHATATKSEIFSFKFSYRGKNSWFMFQSEDGNNFGAAHADDLPYIFKLEAVDTSSNENDRKMTQLLVELITSFAQTGKAKVSIDWPPVSKNPNDNLVQLQINSFDNLTIEAQINQNDNFWKSLEIFENEKFRNDFI